ncbi:hypothetical protein DCAR_0519698 [Daucus carota subsp. sativus]|uniref:ATXR3 C-terminal domain-containing protein n=1 Tax=Daucus carota subsp. sativus TaxID=79200 RepID=A0A164Y501_DAUCS|nr:hypothetical protein DCAR_0519698 [Daucus carota subsp. sativus]
MTRGLVSVPVISLLSLLETIADGCQVLKDCRGILDRHQLMLEVCELNSVSKDDCINVGKAEPGNCFLGGLSNWLIAYSTYLVRFINSKRVKLPDENLRHSVVEKKKYFAEFTMEVEKTDAEVQAEGVCNQQLQNLTLMPDKVYAIYFAAATRNNGA